VTVAVRPGFTRLCFDTSRATVTTRAVRVQVSTGPLAASPGVALRVATRIASGARTTAAGSSVPVWVTPRSFCQRRTALAVAAV
jgi:hypothetical protein